MEIKQLKKSRSLVFVGILMALSFLLISKSGFSQGSNRRVLPFVVTDQQQHNTSETDSVGVAVEICPNPFTREISVALALWQPSEVTVSLVNLEGRRIGQSQKKIQLSPGYTTLNFPVSNIKRGAYVILTEINGYIHARIVRIQKSKSRQLKS